LIDLFRSNHCACRFCE